MLFLTLEFLAFSRIPPRTRLMTTSFSSSPVVELGITIITIITTIIILAPPPPSSPPLQRDEFTEAAAAATTPLSLVSPRRRDLRLLAELEVLCGRVEETDHLTTLIFHVHHHNK